LCGIHDLADVAVGMFMGEARLMQESQNKYRTVLI
jgi:hypothetical protein